MAETLTTQKDFFDLAHVGGFADAFADLLNCEIEVQRRDTSGNSVVKTKKLSQKQAWFIAWYGADPALRKPKHITEAAKYLGKCRKTLYNWLAADWFDTTGVQAWERHFVAANIPQIYHKLLHNAVKEDGATSNTAIKMLLDLRAKHTGQDEQPGPVAAVQVNVNGQGIEISARQKLTERLEALNDAG